MNETNQAEKTWIDRLSSIISGDPQDLEELVKILRQAESRGLFDAQVLAILEGALAVADMRVRDVMIPRSEMVVIHEDDEPETFVKTIIETGHSRFPVIGSTKDEVEGILHGKDLLDYFAQQPRPNLKLPDVMRPVVYIPESKRLSVLLADFRASRNHMAIVVDEHGSVAGLVTIEDVLEQIVGEIDDEHDIEEGSYIKRMSDFEYSVQARTPMDEFNEYFELEFDEEEFDTIGGLVVKSFGHVPKRGEWQHIENIMFEVVRADNRRVHLLKMTINEMVKSE